MMIPSLNSCALFQHLLTVWYIPWTLQTRFHRHSPASSTPPRLHPDTQLTRIDLLARQSPPLASVVGVEQGTSSFRPTLGRHLAGGGSRPSWRRWRQSSARPVRRTQSVGIGYPSNSRVVFCRVVVRALEMEDILDFFVDPWCWSCGRGTE
jgi:hypothetical protein